MRPKSLEKKETEIMPKLVIDANVVIKWFAPKGEKYLKEAIKVLEYIGTGKFEVYAPVFLFAEVSNICFKKKKLPEGRMKEVAEELRKIGISYFDFEKSEVGNIVGMMYKYNTSFYDAIYLYLAKQKKCKLLTFDDELLKIKSLTCSITSVV